MKLYVITDHKNVYSEQWLTEKEVNEIRKLFNFTVILKTEFKRTKNPGN